MSPPQLPVARVLVDTSLPHLDRLFDYRIGPDHDAVAVPGCRVKVRFAGRLAEGFLVERVQESEHEGKLAPLARVVSSEPVLRPDVLAAARSLAHRYAGTVSDVVRLAVPPRHARTEAEESSGVFIPHSRGPVPEELDDFARELTHGVRACWSALPGDDVFGTMAELAARVADRGRGVVVCLPDQNQVSRCAEVFTSVLQGDAYHAVIGSAQKPAARYRAFLSLLRGQRRIAIGTRAAAFAPVDELGLVMMWDDGDDLYVEPRAPYPHAREVLLTRALHASASVLLAGYARSTEAQQLTTTRWCTDIAPVVSRRRAAWPQVTVSDGTETGTAPVRLPHAVFAAIRAADGPVLVQVPRRGYRMSLACTVCRARARCRTCSGPLTQERCGAAPRCTWCGTEDTRWRCPWCSNTGLRAPVVGNVRTAEEFARAFSERTVVTSHGGSTVARVTDPGALVLATPGAEPHARGGYALVVLLDTWLSLSRDDMRAFEEAHRRWFNALALARAGGRAVAVGDAGLLQGLVRADPIGVAARELADRVDAHMPPAARLATISGDPAVIESLADATWTPHSEVLGPVASRVGSRVGSRAAGTQSGDDGPGDDDQQLVIRAPRNEASHLSEQLKTLASDRSRAKLAPVRIEVDPLVF